MYNVYMSVVSQMIMDVPQYFFFLQLHCSIGFYAIFSVEISNVQNINWKNPLLTGDKTDIHDTN